MINRADIDKIRIVEHVDKHRAIRDLLTFLKTLENNKGEIIHNSKTGGSLDKIREYINEAVKSRHSAYKDKKLQENNDRICQIVNGFINDYGVKLEIVDRAGKERTDRKYAIINIYKEYFTFDVNDKSKPFIHI